MSHFFVALVSRRFSAISHTEAFARAERCASAYFVASSLLGNRSARCSRRAGSAANELDLMMMMMTE